METWKWALNMFRKLLSLEEARAEVDQLKLDTLGSEEVLLLKAHNRVLAQDVVSALDIPPFNRSTVDGYAVKATDTFGAAEKNPVCLKVCGIVNIGELPKVNVLTGQTAEIVTGAPIPEGADAVVMVEDTEKSGEELHVFSVVTKGENVMSKGADIKTNEIVLRAGQILCSREIGVLAALGIAKVKVYVIPTVAVLSTGGEVTEPGKSLPSGKIYDINAYSLYSAVLECGGNPLYLGVVPDDKFKLRETMQQALKCADVIVTSGGVSVGPKDLMPQTVASLGEPGLLFSGVAIKPGKPTTLAMVNGKVVFALPGHPTSALLMFQLLVRPVVWRLSGRTAAEPAVVKAVAGMRMFSAKGRRTFVMVKLHKNDSDRYVADMVETGASGAITTLAKADGYVEVPEDVQFVDKDEEVEVALF
ncbi:MAG TPA: gephyrin-like molybdotransferase Glp [Candidatus Sulfotelmatobacter sp.]|nr:gephyrin-like molybdotransferase Glp [Candidatus Sulfotelmatobacter sp.]